MLEQIVAAQKDYFSKKKTLPYAARMNALNALEKSILKYQDEIYAALWQDLNKSETEAFMTEVSMVLTELKYVKRHLKRWMSEEVVSTPFAHFPSKSFIVSEPFGTVLIISPWNYPFMLSIDPLIGALCAGNTAVIKPSSYSPATSDVIEKIISDAFDSEYVTVVRLKQGQNDLLLEQNFDFIFFTGSVNVGKKIMKQAEKEIEYKFGPRLKKLNRSQGKILIKLIDRETGSDSYALVKELRGNFRAFFYQALGKLFGYNLRSKYDPANNEEDRMIERIIYGIETKRL